MYAGGATQHPLSVALKDVALEHYVHCNPKIPRALCRESLKFCIPAAAVSILQGLSPLQTQQ